MFRPRGLDQASLHGPTYDSRTLFAIRRGGGGASAMRGLGKPFRPMQRALRVAAETASAAPRRGDFGRHPVGDHRKRIPSKMIGDWAVIGFFMREIQKVGNADERRRVPAINPRRRAGG